MTIKEAAIYAPGVWKVDEILRSPAMKEAFEAGAEEVESNPVANANNFVVL